RPEACVRARRTVVQRPVPKLLHRPARRREPGNVSCRRLPRGNCRICGCRYWSDHQHLVSIAVRAGLRRRGIAQALLDDLFERSRSGPLRLELRRSNHEALQLYMKNDFRETGIAHSYYTDGEDAIRMEKLIEK